MKKYPECEKLAKVSADSNKIGQFLEWLINEKEIIFCRNQEVYCPDPECHEPHSTFDCSRCGEKIGLVYIDTNIKIETILAEYFKIDLKKVEKERCQILDDIRKQG